MIKSIYVFNVGYGDCAILSNSDNCAMLVDCGSTYKKKSSNVIGLNSTQIYVDDVAEKVEEIMMKFDKKYLLISHLHNDHFNCLQYFKNIVFDEVYLPNYLDNNYLDITFAEILLCKEKRRNNLIALLNIPHLLGKHKLINNNTRIKFVNANDKIYNDLGTFEILAPQKKKYKFNNNICGLLRKNETINDLKLKYLNQFVEADNKDFYSFKNNQDMYNLIYTKTLNNNFDQINLIKKYEKEIKSYYYKLHNDLSIVFHNIYNDNYKVLFCGDSKTSNLKKINKYHEKYKVIKVSHHGTEDYYFEYLPKTDYLIINNTKYRNYKKISKKYDDMYGSDSILICTDNNNCEKICNNISCNCVMNKKAICKIKKYYEVIK